MKKSSCAVLMAMMFVAAVDGRQAPGDAAALAKIRDEGLNRSKVNEPFDMFVNVIGPRLTGSPAHKRAAEYARDTLATWGMVNVHLEPWEFGRGWELQKLTIEMVEPRYMPLLGYAEAWTPSTPGELVVPALSTAGKSADEIAQMPLAGAAVLTQPVITAFIDKDREQPTLVLGARIGAPPAPRSGGAGRAASAPGAGAPATAGQGRGVGTGRGANPSPTAKAAVLIKPSLGIDGTVFVQAGRESPAATQPAIVLAAEHYNIVARLLQQNIPVKLRVNVQTKFYDADRNSYNVVAEIPGTDPALKDEVVMLGAHLDSWHTATGATDNADGAAQVMEAFRIIKATGLQPRRTLRMALWSGEEEGLYGSQHYVTDHLTGDAHKADRDKMDVYFNIDPGTGPIYGWYMENNPAAKAIFDDWLAPLKDLGARMNILPGITNTDHLSFMKAGIPAFNPIQDYTDYDTRLHHTNVDTAERVNDADLKKTAVVLAWFVYEAAMRTERIPSATAPAPASTPAPAAAPTVSSSVMGSLRTADNSAIANASIQLRNIPSGLLAATTTTDRSGQFRFDDVAPGDYNVAYVPEDTLHLMALGQPFKVVKGETVTTSVRMASPSAAAGLSSTASRSTGAAPVATPKLTTVVGYLREGSSKPIPDAAVRLRNTQTQAVVASLRTNASGEFQFGGIAPGKYVVEEIADKDQKVLATGSEFAVFAGQTISTFVRVKGVSIR